MASFAKMIILGRLVCDPVQAVTKTKKHVTSLRIATSFRTAEKKDTQVHLVSVWDERGDDCMKFLKKGSTAYVEGVLRVRQFTRGGYRYVQNEVVATELKFLSSDQEVTDVPDDVPEG